MNTKKGIILSASFFFLINVLGIYFWVGKNWAVSVIQSLLTTAIWISLVTGFRYWKSNEKPATSKSKKI